jgi:hypothetical protein
MPRRFPPPEEDENTDPPIADQRNFYEVEK